MLVYFLLGFILIQMTKGFHNKVETLKDCLLYLAPFETKRDKLQLCVTITLSLMLATKVNGVTQKVTLFILAYVSIIWLTKIVVYLIEWLEECLSIMPTHVIFTFCVPFIIFVNLRSIDTPLEVWVYFCALLMNVIMIYMELISFLLGRRAYKKTAKYLSTNNARKLKSILTWLFVILFNLYTLILFIQFYVKACHYHFIEAKVLTKSSAVDLFYYLVVTFTTVGFGDIQPHTLIAKLVTALIALSGMIFTCVFVACILNLKDN